MVPRRADLRIVLYRQSRFPSLPRAPIASIPRLHASTQLRLDGIDAFGNRCRKGRMTLLSAMIEENVKL